MLAAPPAPQSQCLATLQDWLLQAGNHTRTLPPQYAKRGVSERLRVVAELDLLPASPQQEAMTRRLKVMAQVQYGFPSLSETPMGISCDPTVTSYRLVVPRFLPPVLAT